MANILIAGDSWGIGVFSGQGSDYGPTGQGIQSLLEEKGHSVTNISKGGGSNGLMIDRLLGRWGDTGRCLFGLEPHLKINIDFDTINHIVFLQTDIFRERHYYGKQYPSDENTQWKILEQDFVNQLITYDTIEQIIHTYFKKFYTELNAIGIEHNKKIIMVGGWNQLHPCIIDYTNLIPAIYSSTKLLIPELKEDCYISDPEWFSQLDEESRFMSKFGNEFKRMAITNAEKLNLIYRYWNEVHPDISGYNKIVNKLLPYFG